MLGIAGLVGFDHVRAQQVHIPHHLGTASKVVSAPGCHRTFRCRAVVVFTADLDSENWCAFGEAHARPLASMVRGVRAESFPMGKIHLETRPISIRPASSGLSGIGPETRSNFETCKARIIPCWRHLDDLPVDQ